MKFFVIADNDTALGFRFAGVESVAVSDAQAARAEFQKAAGNPEVGIIIITDVVAQGIRQEVDAARAKGVKPLVVEIPGRSGPLEGRGSLLDLITEAIGVRL